MKFTMKNGRIRFYDSAATPYYLELKLDAGDGSWPTGRGRPEENLVLDRGNINAQMHYIEGMDDPIMEPLPFTLTATIRDDANTGYFLTWLEQAQNGDSASPVQSSATVNGHTLTSTKGDTQNDGANDNPQFADGKKMAFNLEILYDGATDILWNLGEVFFPLDEQSITEGEDGVNLALSGQIYGTITRAAAFTAGTDVTA